MTSREDIAFYHNLGICPRCRTNTIMGEEKYCPECRAKQAIYMQALRNDLSRYEKEREKIKEYNKIRVQTRKEKGICIECGFRRAKYNRVRCEICLEKNKTDKRKGA